MPRPFDTVREAGHDWVSRVSTATHNVAETGASTGATGTAPEAAGLHHPDDVADAIPLVDRAFAFVDLCGFTGFIATHGEHAAIDTLQRFRSLTRDVAARRGVRIDKWLGDGAMLVGTEVGPAIAAAAELVGRYHCDPLALRGGIAHGQVLLLDGDDYIGRPANLAARLCQTARPGELLAVGYPADVLPGWIRVVGTRSVTLRGLGRFRRVQVLGLDAALLRDALSGPRRDGDGV